MVVLVAALGACTSSEPTAIVRGPATGASDAADATTVPGTSSTVPSGEAPSGEDVGPEHPGDFVTLSRWQPCAGSFECATLTVPRDWADPEGDSLELAVTRHPAEGARIGSLILNPGGPGASGVDFVQGFVDGGLPDGLTDRFDVVSWDPRGTGGTNRIDCTTDEELLEPDIDPTPDDQADVDAIRAEAEAAMAVCDREFGDLLPYVGTRATVRDLDGLRAALGDDALTYVGYSYGTTIGMEYLRLYPERVRAMVLDGVSVPGADPIADTYAQGAGFERTLDAYLDDCPSRRTCPLGDDPKATLLGLVDALEQGSIPADYQLQADGSPPREGELGVGELYIAVAASLYDDAAWSLLDQGLEEALDDRPQGRTLLALRDDYLGRQVDGTWLDDSDARGSIRCADQVERSAEPEGDLGLAEAWSEHLPFWGAFFGTGNPGCWGLPDAVDPLLPMAAGDLTGAPPVVVVGTTNDPATPYEQAEEAAEIIDGSVLVTYEGDVHTAYRSLSDCVDDAVTPYLVELTVPDDGLRC